MTSAMACSSRARWHSNSPTDSASAFRNRISTWKESRSDSVGCASSKSMSLIQFLVTENAGTGPAFLAEDSVRIMVSFCACPHYMGTVSARHELPQLHGLVSAKLDGYALSRAPPLYMMM